MSREESIEEIINAAVDRVVQRFIPAISRAVAEVAATSAKARGSERRSTKPRRRRTRGEMTRWVADTRARRVPTFVIEATGLDTKKKIVAKFGENAAFEKGKPLPAAKTAGAHAGAAKRGAKVLKAPPATATAARVVNAKPPIVRKAARK